MAATYVLDDRWKSESSIIRWNVLDAQGRIEIWVEANRGKVAFSGVPNGVDADVLDQFQSALEAASRAAATYNAIT